MELSSLRSKLFLGTWTVSYCLPGLYVVQGCHELFGILQINIKKELKARVSAVDANGFFLSALQNCSVEVGPRGLRFVSNI